MRSTADMQLIGLVNGLYDNGLQLMMNSAAMGDAQLTKNKYSGVTWRAGDDGKYYRKQYGNEQEIPYSEWENEQKDYNLALETLDGKGKLY